MKICYFHRMETILIQTDNKEQSRAVKAVLRALKVNFTTKGKPMSEIDLNEALRISQSIKKGLKEAQEIEGGKIKPLSINELLNEL